MSKIGVFICHCGENISATVDCEKETVWTNLTQNSLTICDLSEKIFGYS